MLGLITGANRGLGYELVKEGLKRGHTILAACRCVERERAEDLWKLKEVYQERLCILKMDVTKEEEVKQAADRVKAEWGKLDFLINNAGVLFEKMVMPGDCIGDLDIEMLRKTLDVNITGTAIVLKYFIRLLYGSASACIMNITSEAGHLTPEGYNYLAYSVSKHGANMYTQKIRNYLKEEKQEKNIRVFMIHPGRMDTVMGRENAQIPPARSAVGVLDILENRKQIPEMDIPFINYKGEPMPY